MLEKNAYEMDAAMFDTTAPEEFTDLLADREANASWSEIAVSEVELLPHTNDVEGIEEEARREALYSTSSSMGHHALRDIALPSLLERARISGSALGEMPVEDVADIVTRCLRTSRDTTNIRMQDGKIGAFMANSVVKLPQPELYRIATSEIAKSYGGQFVSGTWSHRITVGGYECHVPTADFMTLFTDKGLHFADIVMGITVTTSDTGYSGVNIYPSLVGIMSNGGKMQLPILGETAMPHKGKASMDAFKENLSTVFVKAQQSKERIAQMDQIVLNYPFNAFCNALKKSGIGKKSARSVIDSVAVLYNTPQKVTAADLYFKACEIPMCAEDGDQMTLLALTESVAKFLKFSDTLWHKEFDRPVNCWSFSANPQ